MFTGIIQALQPVGVVEKRGACLAVRVKKPGSWNLVLGQSVMIDGICSTVTRVGASFFEVEYMPETLRKTTAAMFRKNSQVNLERSLTLGDYIDGHLVSGHVDGRGVVRAVTPDGKTKEVTFEIPQALSKYVATKGSITINGVSLTVMKATGKKLTVALIPYTLTHTNLGLLKKGDTVNVEVDIVARYVERMLGEGNDK